MLVGLVAVDTQLVALVELLDWGFLLIPPTLAPKEKSCSSLCCLQTEWLLVFIAGKNSVSEWILEGKELKKAKISEYLPQVSEYCPRAVNICPKAVNIAQGL